MELIEKHGDEFKFTDDGRQFVSRAVEEWAPIDGTVAGKTESSAGTYETTIHARVVDPEFRATVLSRHGQTCPISGVDHPGLLDVEHVLSWMTTHNIERMWRTCCRSVRHIKLPSIEASSRLIKTTKSKWTQNSRQKVSCYAGQSQIELVSE